MREISQGLVKQFDFRNKGILLAMTNSEQSINLFVPYLRINLLMVEDLVWNVPGQVFLGLKLKDRAGSHFFRRCSI